MGDRTSGMHDPSMGHAVDALECRERLRRQEKGDDEYEKADPLTRAFFASRLRLFVSLVEQYVRRSGDITILDAGCGDGHLLRSLRERLAGRSPSFFGCDFSAARVGEARRRTVGACLSVANLKVMPFGSERFDLVTCTDVLEHVVEPELAVRELARIVKPGGLLLIAIPHELWWEFCRILLLRFPPRVPGHINDLSPAWVCSVLPEWKMEEMKAMPLGGLPWFLALHATVLMRKPT